MTARPREKHVLKACLDLLKFRGVLAWRNNVGAMKSSERFIRFGKVGSSDILGVIHWRGAGRLLAVETKRVGGKPTPAQEAFLAAVRRAGGVAVVISDVKALDRLLDRLEVDPWREDCTEVIEPTREG